MSLEAIVKRLNDGPAVLFLGQKYLSIESGADPILTKIYTKYSNDKPITNSSYQSITKLGLGKDAVSFFQWMQGLSKSVSVPGWLEYIGKFRWASVYTTAYDTVLERAFLTETRSVQPIVNDKYVISDPRNKHHLHISYLMGYIATSDPSDKPPLTAMDGFRRKTIGDALLNRLNSVVTPKGLLVIEGYDVEDQLSVHDFFAYVSRLSRDQVLLCNASEKLLSNELLKELIDVGIVHSSPDSFSKLLAEWQTQGKINENINEQQDNYGRWLTIAGERVRLPDELYSKVSRYAFIPDDATFKKDLETSDAEKYRDFRRFLASSNFSPDWQGYSSGFAFKRDFFIELKNTTLRFYESKERLEAPIILAGQTSSGKTIALGQLVYDLRNECQYPVLFIPKRYQRVDEYTIDSFCSWAEQQKARNTVIIWDGMLDGESYYQLLRWLTRRGRNVILVGSTYNTTDQPKTAHLNYVQAPIDLNDSEKKSFVDFIRKINEQLGINIQSQAEPNMLALLYRFLPADRAQIVSGIHDEYKFFIRMLSNITNAQPKNPTAFYEALSELGYVPSDEDLEFFKKPLFMDGESVSTADFLIFSVMVVGQHGLNVPFELLLDAVGYDAFATHIFRALNQIDMIKWFEDQDGNLELGARTTLEAQLLSRYAGGKHFEVKYIIALLRGIRTQIGKDFGDFDRQIEFAVRLLGDIGPNTSPYFIDSYYEITELLKDLRQNRQAYHPRLVLKEANFLRSIVKVRNQLPHIDESDLELLKRAEEIVRAALDELGANSERMIAAYLRVELSSICGYISQQYITLGEKDLAKEYYYESRSINNVSFATNPGNFRAVDIAYWTTEKMIDANLFNNEERLDAESDLLSLIEMVEVEGVSDEHVEEFAELKLKIYNLIGQNELVDALYESMEQNGFTAGIYFKAKRILGLDSIVGTPNDEQLKKNKDVLHFLMGHFEQIKTDGRCLFLLLKTWWVSKTNNVFFGEEKQALPFSPDDWGFCQHVTGLLLLNGDKFLSATVYYIYALAQFHLDDIKGAMKSFKELQEQSYRGSYGRKRIAKYYFYSTSGGYPREFDGEVSESVSRSRGEKRSNIYVGEIDINIPFFLGDFGQSSFQKGDKVRNFLIAFNFLGPIAVPAKN